MIINGTVEETSKVQTISTKLLLMLTVFCQYRQIRRVTAIFQIYDIFI